MFTIGYRQLLECDAPFIEEMFTDPDIMRFLGPRRPLSEDEITDWMQTYLAKPLHCPVRQVVTADSEFAGFCGVQYVNDVPDFGYYFRRKFWGTGVASCASGPLLAEAYRRFGDHLHIFIADSNVSSIRLAGKIGLSPNKRTTEDGLCGWLYLPCNQLKKEINDACRQI